MSRLIEPTARGLYCAAGDFYIDPTQGVDRAVITHAHSDHARPGSGVYFCAPNCMPLLRQRLGTGAAIETGAFGATRHVGDVHVSLHPSGHVLGSAQVRIEYRGEVWVVSGDYKTERCVTCEPFEPVHCHTFLTECTFGQPFYRWQPQAEIFADLNAWWRANAGHGFVSIICAYSLGKAQRVLAGLDPGNGPIVVHPSVAALLPAYAAAGIAFPPLADNVVPGTLVIAPSVQMAVRDLTGALPVRTAFASGWMLMQGAARRFGVSRGFVLSDHADWTGLTETIRATGATSIGVMHGDTRELRRWLTAQALHNWSANLPVVPRGQLEFAFP